MHRNCLLSCCFPTLYNLLVIFFSTLFHKLLLFFGYIFSLHCHLRMAGVRSLLLLLLVTWLKLTDCQLFYLLPVSITYQYLFVSEPAISPEIPVTEVRKSWFTEPETSPNGFPTVRVALQEPKTVTQLRFFKLR